MDCGWMGNYVIKDDITGAWSCPDCDNIIFLSQEELDEYLFYTEKPTIEPFEKPNKMEW